MCGCRISGSNPGTLNILQTAAAASTVVAVAADAAKNIKINMFDKCPVSVDHCVKEAWADPSPC